MNTEYIFKPKIAKNESLKYYDGIFIKCSLSLQEINKEYWFYVIIL